MKATHTFRPAGVDRRTFLRWGAFSAAGLLLGCATNPVTGESQLMLMSEATEIDIDRRQSPHQFSSDYGSLQDKPLNAYLEDTGRRMSGVAHRRQMPYTFRGVNAVYVNAYAFPGGSIAVTRGILLELKNEAELAALLGHELGHVNARHTAEIMSKKALATTVLGGLSAYIGAQNAGAGELATNVGLLGTGALLAAYSRDNERQADALGLEYLVRAGYGSDGMSGLMKMLDSLSAGQLSAAQLLFATHPMSAERYRAALAAQKAYPAARQAPLYRERYMDHTAGLRRIQPAIEALQAGEGAMARQAFPEAEGEFKKALQQIPGDYAGLAMMSKCQLARGNYAEAGRYAQSAKEVFPEEAQAYHLSGFAKLQTREFDAALDDFTRYERLLPGNPNTTFFVGVAYEGQENRKAASNQYYNYLQVVKQGPLAKHAYQRLVEWGAIKAPQ